MPEQTKAAASQAELVEEIARQQEEILRLRDLLIAKDAELGTAKGRLAELAEHSAHFVAVVHRVRAQVPARLRQLLARLRRRG
jgi:hypothetical protein